MAYDSLAHVSPFSSERCPDGLVAIAENSLRILSVEHRTGSPFTAQVLRTRHTPCKILVHPETNNLIVLEKDHAAYPKRLLDQEAEKTWKKEQEESKVEPTELDWATLGSYPKAPADTFASCVRIVDPFTMETLHVVEFENNECCFAIYCSQGSIQAPGA